MSRLGKKFIVMPDKVKGVVSNGLLEIAGPKGKMSQNIFDNLEVVVEKDRLFVKNTVPPNVRKTRKIFNRADSLQGLLRTLIKNKITGVVEGFEKILEIHGVGYKCELKGKKLILHIGYNHPVEVEVPDMITMEIVRDTIIFIRGIDKELVGNFTAKVRGTCPPEPYKGKGIRYRGEYVKHKVGKAAIGTQK